MTTINPWSIVVETPLGQFPSIKAAARAHKIDPNLVRWRCAKGEQQRQNLVKTYKDFSAWKILGTRKRPYRREVATPLGVFNSVSEAARAHSVTSAAILHKIKADHTGYHYL